MKVAEGPEHATVPPWRPWSDLSPTERRRRADTAAWATLQRLAVSSAARRLTLEVLEGTVLPAKAAKLGTALRPSSRAALEEAVAAVLGDVLQAASKDWAVKRSVRKEAFTGQRVGRTPWEDVTKPMLAAGLLDYTPGQGLMPGQLGKARAAVLSATPSLVALAADCGVDLSTIGRHFQALKPDAFKLAGEAP